VRHGQRFQSSRLLPSFQLHHRPLAGLANSTVASRCHFYGALGTLLDAFGSFWDPMAPPKSKVATEILGLEPPKNYGVLRLT
jgi:hypothetical protein